MFMGLNLSAAKLVDVGQAGEKEVCLGQWVTSV